MDRPEGFQTTRPSTSNPQRRARGPRQAGAKRTSTQALPKALAKRRKRAEKEEYRGYTRATRKRRLVWTVSLGSVALLAVSVAVLTLSPALALRQVNVEGSSRVEPRVIEEALAGLYGEPLARVSADRVSEALEPIALIQAFTTRIEPPHTLVVTIMERQPVGVIQSGSEFVVVDPAGVSLWREATRPEGLPRITSSPGANPSSFSASVRALAAIPEEVLAQIDAVSATTLDDVRFTMTGSEHVVVWGSGERSREKARVLPAALVAAGLGQAKVIDVTTPDSVVIRDKQ